MAHADTYIRQLTINDLDECVAVEAAAFPPNEAASREKVCTKNIDCGQF
jgi:hypothetical protein